jgi:hypothetical protein
MFGRLLSEQLAALFEADLLRRRRPGIPGHDCRSLRRDHAAAGRVFDMQRDGVDVVRRQGASRAPGPRVGT